MYGLRDSVMLGTLDMNCTTWETSRQANAQLYRTLKEKFCSCYPDEEDLLGLGCNNIEKELWEEIALDTKRTHSSLNFFQAVVGKPGLGGVYANRPTRHCDMLTRLLYIWAKTSPTVRYVQG
jgi:hypothetical protein